MAFKHPAIRKNKLSSGEVYKRSAIRNVTIIFGSIFSDIHVRNYNTDGTISENTTLVPLVYAAKDNYGYWIEQVMRLPEGNIEINTKLPRMSFEMTGLQMAYERGMNTNLPIYARKINQYGTQQKSRTPISYSFEFSLSIWCKQMDDSIQILDYILPMFTPDVSIKLKESTKMNIVNDVVINLNSITKNDNWNNSFEENRIIQWELSFTAFADILPENEESAVIQSAVINNLEANVDAYLNGRPPKYMEEPTQIFKFKEETVPHGRK